MTSEANRRVLFAVELVDAAAGAVVSRDMAVQLNGVTSQPISNASGRFVWLSERDTSVWPTTITVTSHGAPFAPDVVPVEPPADPQHPTPAERFARIMLRPTAAYPFAAGVTAVRGRLTEAKHDDTPVAGARVLLAWCGHDFKWVPPFPATESDDGERLLPGEVETDLRGEFGVYARVGPGADPDVDEMGFLKVRVQVTRLAHLPRTRVTPPKFAFVPDPDAAGRVPEGRLLTPDVQLRWADLTAP